MVTVKPSSGPTQDELTRPASSKRFTRAKITLASTAGGLWHTRGLAGTAPARPLPVGQRQVGYYLFRWGTGVKHLTFRVT